MEHTLIRDIDKVLIGRDEIARRVQEMGAELANDLAEAVKGEGDAPEDAGHIVFIPILTGSIVFVADLIRHMPMKLSLELVAVSSYPGKSMESKGVSIRSALPDDLEGKHVVLADDILDSGRTLAMIRSLVEEQNPASVRVCVLLEKKIEGYTPPIRADYAGFEIPDEFVVGYGLDYNGLYRNHPEIVTLKPEAL